MLNVEILNQVDFIQFIMCISHDAS